MESAVGTIAPYVGELLARVIVAAIILLIGWGVSALIARVVKGILNRLKLDNRLAAAVDPKQGAGMPIESWISTLVFWLIMLFFIIGALEVLNLTAITEPLNALLNEIVLWLPGLLAAGILALLAHVIGSLARRLVTGLLDRNKVEEKVSTNSGTAVSFASPLGDAVYYLVWLFFLPAILGALGLQSLLIPVTAMVNQFLSFVPLLAAAALILLVGWFVARIVQKIVTSFLASVGVDAFAERVGMAKYMGGITVSYLLGLIVFIVILIPIVTAALDALHLESLTAPLTAMMTEVISNVPHYIAAAAILILTYVIGRWIIGVLVEILTGLGVNSIPPALGLGKTGTIGSRTLAEWIGDVLLLILMLLATVQAAQVIGWTAVTEAVGNLGTQIVAIVFGLLIIAVGIYIANLAAQFIDGMAVKNKGFLAMVARVTIIAFAGAMGLTAMGFATSIVVIAFALFFGAIAIAVALSFGLGGRETAGKQIAQWAAAMEKAEVEPPTTPSATPPAMPPALPPTTPPASM